MESPVSAKVSYRNSRLARILRASYFAKEMLDASLSQRSRSPNLFQNHLLLPLQILGRKHACALVSDDMRLREQKSISIPQLLKLLVTIENNWMF